MDTRSNPALNIGTLLLLIVGVSTLHVREAHSSTITPTFTAAFDTSFGANATAAKNSWIAAANVFTSNFSDNIHINIIVDAVADSSVFGQSSFGINSTTYANMRTKLVADSKTANDGIALGLGGSFTAVNPGPANWSVSRAQAKAIGLIGDDLLNDGTTKFGAGNPFTFSGAIAAGTSDFQAVAAHEILRSHGALR